MQTLTAPVRQLTRRAGTLAKSGGMIVLLAIAMSNLIRVINSMTLTRMLDARAFGITGILSSITFILAIVSDVGLAPFVVRHKDALSGPFLDEVWSLRLVRSGCLTILMIALAWPISAYAGKPELRWPIVVWAFTFLFDGLSSMAFATAVRNRQLIRLNSVDVIAAVFQLLYAVALAVWLRSYWAIIFAVVMGSATKAILSYRMFASSRRRFAWSRQRAREVWQFSRLITAAGFFSLALSQSDKLFFARMMSLSDYGIYSLASSLAVMPLVFVGNYVHQVMYPAFVAKLREDCLSHAEVFYGTVQRLAIYYLAGVGIILGLARVIIAIVYDARYQSAALYFQVLGITSLLAIYTWSSDQFCIAIGKTGSTLVAHVVRVCWLFGLGSVGWMVFGPIGLAVAVGTIDVPASIWYAIQRHRLDALRWRNELSMLSTAAASVAVGLTLSYGATSLGVVTFLHKISARI